MTKHEYIEQHLKGLGHYKEITKQMIDECDFWHEFPSGTVSNAYTTMINFVKHLTKGYGTKVLKNERTKKAILGITLDEWEQISNNDLGSITEENVKLLDQFMKKHVED